MKSNSSFRITAGLLDPFAATLATLKSLPRSVWILFFGTFLNKFGTFVIPFLALYLTHQGYSTGEAGLAMGAYGAGHLLASALGGYLADHFGRRNTIVVSMFSTAAAMMSLSQASGLRWIVALTFLTGLTAELYRPASGALLTDLVPAGQRVTAFSAYRLAFNAGWAFGPATAGLLAQHSFFWLFVGDAATSVLFGLVAWFALPHGIRTAPTESGWSAALQLIRHDRRFLQVLAASFVIALVFMQMSSTFGLHVESRGLSSAVYGMLISLNGALVVLCELPLTSFTQRLPARRVMAIGYVLVGAGFALTALAHTAPALVAVVITFTIGEMIAMPVAAAYVADLAPTNLRGRYMGVFGLTWATALTCGPALGMTLFAQRPGTLWIGCGVLGALAALIVLHKSRVEPRTSPTDDRGNPHP